VDLYSFYVSWKLRQDLEVFFNLIWHTWCWWIIDFLQRFPYLGYYLLTLSNFRMLLLALFCNTNLILLCLCRVVGLNKSYLLYLLGLTSAGLQISTYPVCIWLLEREGMESISCYHHLHEGHASFLSIYNFVNYFQ